MMRSANLVIIPLLLAALAGAALILSQTRHSPPVSAASRVVETPTDAPGFYRPYRGWGRAPERTPWTQG